MSKELHIDRPYLDLVNDYLADTYKETNVSTYDGVTKIWTDIRPAMKCKDGYQISVQASAGHYCKPRCTFKPDSFCTYDEVELGFPNMPDVLIKEYAEEPDDPTHTIYPYVPVKVVEELIEKHGGLV